MYILLLATVFLVSSTSFALSDSDKECLASETEILSRENLDSITKVTDQVDVRAWNECVKELYYHKDIPLEMRDTHWHELAGTKYFGTQCWNLDGGGDKEMIFSFLSDSGFKVMKFPVYRGAKILPQNMFKFKADGKTYLISQFDKIGESFETLTEDKIVTFARERNLLVNPATIKPKFIDAYEAELVKNKRQTIALSEPSDNLVSISDAQSCIKERLLVYVYSVWNRKHRDMISSERSKASGKNSQELKNKLKDVTFSDGSSCRSIIQDSDMEKVLKRFW